MSEHQHHHNYIHGHGHEHHHEQDHVYIGTGGESAQTTALLEYMLEHNRSHAGELGELAHKLHHSGQQAAADLLSLGVKDFESGNEKLAKALKLVKGGHA
ncbi:hypothetical protein FACS1894142_8060 [Spirochaetia bacterium]|nr:hypothetical protein FACS1894142_8060 [Spirochaetia bacterium]